MFLLSILFAVIGSIIAAYTHPGHAAAGALIGFVVGVALWILRALGVGLGWLGDAVDVAVDVATDWDGDGDSSGGDSSDGDSSGD